jgi:hypothetical protein
MTWGNMSRIAYESAPIVGRSATIAVALARQALARPHHEALRFCDALGWRFYTWEQVDHYVTDLAAALEFSGLRRGDVVVMHTVHDERSICLELAVNRLGGVVVPLDPRTTESELFQVLRETQPHLFITSFPVCLPNNCRAPMVQVAEDFSRLLRLGSAVESVRNWSVDRLDAAVVFPVFRATGRLSLIANSHASQTYAGACLVAMSVINEQDVIVSIAGSPVSLTRSVVSAWLASGAVLGIAPEDVSNDYTSVLRPTILVGSSEGLANHCSAGLERSDEGETKATKEPWLVDPPHLMKLQDQGEAPPAEAASDLIDPHSKLGLILGRNRGSKLGPEPPQKPGPIRAQEGSHNLRLVLCEGGLNPKLRDTFRLRGVTCRGMLTSPVAGGLIAMESVDSLGTGLGIWALPYTEISADGDGRLCVRGLSVTQDEIEHWPPVSTAAEPRQHWKSLDLTGEVATDGSVVLNFDVGDQPNPPYAEVPQPRSSPRASGDPDFTAPIDLATPTAEEIEKLYRVPHPSEVVRAELVSGPDRDDDGDVQTQWADEICTRFRRLCAPANGLFVTRRADHLVGLVALNFEALLNWGKTHQVGGAGFAEIAASPEAYAFIQTCLQALNGRLDPADRILNFAILEAPLPEPQLPRTVVLRRYAVLLDQLVGSVATPLGA